MMLTPPLTPAHQIDSQLALAGYAVIDAETVANLASVDFSELRALTHYWEDLAPDAHLRDGGRYRRRRHASLIVDGGLVRTVPHRAHWQSLDYNALHGGIERWFEPMPAEWVGIGAFRGLLVAFAAVATALRPGTGRWFVEAHPFRIDCAEGIGRPTPEGAHRDGVDLVVVLLVARNEIRGGETRVFEADGPQGVRFTLHEPWSGLLLDDERVIHESTPIQPVRAGLPGWRDTLVLTYRRGSFQDAPPPGNPRR